MEEIEYVNINLEVRLRLILNQLRDLGGFSDDQSITQAVEVLSTLFTKVVNEAKVKGGDK